MKTTTKDNIIITTLEQKLRTGKVKNRYALKGKIKKLKNNRRINEWLGQ